MTFMWRQIMLMDVGFKDENNYSLFLYGEGRYAYDFLNTKRVNGIPIIFVPGNAGSGRQVRSLASVLQNKTETQNVNFHFDVFAVDFNEEFSGLHPNYLKRHSRSLRKAIKHVWNMYQPSPTGIILYSHSIGGIVSKLVLNDAEIRDKVVLLLGLAAPFGRSPFPFHGDMTRVWEQLWQTEATVPVISVDGGLRDELIDPEWTYAPSVLHASSTEIDDVWLETDHQCIVWCNQLVRQNSRFLFDYARSPSKFATNYRELFHRHFKNSLRHARLTKPTTDSKLVSSDDCNPKCPERGTLKLNSTFDKVFVSIGDRFAPQLTANGKFVGEAHACGGKICSFYAGNVDEAAIELPRRTAWVLKAEVDDVLHLSAFKGRSRRFSFVGFKRMKVEFDYPLLVYRLHVVSTQPIQNVIYKTNRTKRLAKGGDHRQAVTLNLVGANDSDAQLLFFGHESADVELHVQVDLGNSIIKFVRQNQRAIISSLLPLHCVLVFVRLDGVLASFGVVFLLNHFLNSTFRFLLVIPLVLPVYLLVLAINSLLLPLFRWLQKRKLTLGLKLQTSVFAFLLGFSLIEHPYPLVLFSVFCLLSNGAHLGNVIVWGELFLILSIPSAFEFVFDLLMPKSFTYSTRLFMGSSIVFAFNSYFFTISRQFQITRFSFNLYFLFGVIVCLIGSLGLWLADHSLGLELDCTLCSMFMSFELGMLWMKELRSAK